MDSKKQAQGIASLGRYGDTTLMHMRPDEVDQLTAISRASGGDITINPDTGMPEAFLGNFFSALAPTAAGLAAGAIFPGAYAPYLAAGAGGLTAYAQGKRDPLGIAMGALGGYGGGTIGQNLAATGGVQVPAGSAESSLIQPTNAAVDTTQGINMSTGQVVGGANVYTPKTYPAGTGSNLGSGALRTQGGVGISPSTPNQVYQAGPDRLYQPNMNQVNSFTYADGVRQDAINTGGYDALQGRGSSALTTRGGQGFPQPVDFTEKGGSGLFEQGYEYAQNKFGQLGRGVEGVFTDSNKRAEFFGRMGGAQYDEAGNLIKAGSEGAGMLKTALPFAGAGLEAYQKGIYEDMPTYETSTAGMYDPTRRLNLGMDTGLRLLAKGGRVAFEEGGVVRDRSYYGINPQYNTSGATYSPIMGMQGGQQTRVPVQGFVDVGGKFVADPKGTMSDIDYENRFKYVTKGVAKPGNQDGGDFESKAGIQGGAGGINPAVALQAAQGYAESQQSDLNQQGLGGLRKGGAIRYQQGGKTTAEMNTAKTATPPPTTTMDLMLAKKNEEEMANQGLPAGLNIQAIQAQAQQQGMAEGGIAELTPDDGKMLNGNGDGVSDEIPAMIEGEQEAALSDGEFIVPARIVSELGNGSSDAGAKKLYAMIDRIQAARQQTIGDNKQYAKDTNAERFLPV